MMSNEKFKKLSLASVAALASLSGGASAGDWGVMIGHNNPAGSNVGLNFLYQSAGVWGFEAGVGGIYGQSGNSSRFVATWGDVDLKWFAGHGFWRPFLEGGMAVALGTGTGGGGIAAGSPFVGGGLLYSGTTMLFHITADYKINSGAFYPAAGIGFKF